MNNKILVLFTLISFQNSNCQYKPKTEINMYKINTYFETNWNNDLKEEYVSAPQTSLFDPTRKSDEKIRKDILFRMFDKFCLILSGQDIDTDGHTEISFLLIDNGEIARKRIFINSSIRLNRIIDFNVMEEGRIGMLIEGLEEAKSEYMFITLDKDGKQNEVKITYPENQKYIDIRKIRTFNNAVFFDVKVVDGRGLYELQDDGRAQEIYHNKHAFGIFVHDEDNLLVALSSSDYSEYYLALVNATSGMESLKAIAPELKAHIAIPLFNDTTGNIYATSGKEVAKLNIFDQSVGVFSCQNILPLIDGEFLVCNRDQSGIAVTKTKNGSLKDQVALSLKLPQELTPVNQFILSNIDHKNNFITSLKKKGEAEILLRYTPEGVFDGKLAETDKLNSYSLQRTSTWQVDENGNLFLPVSDSEGFRIIEISPIL